MSGFGGFGNFGEAWNDDVGDEDEGDIELTASYGSRDGLLFLVDCSKQMFDVDGAECAVTLAMRCAKTVYQNKIISSENDALGIILFGTERTDNPSDFKHVCVLQELGQLNGKRVRSVEDIINDVGKFKKDYGQSNDYLLSEVFWLCSNLFSKYPEKLGFKRILLFTNNDNPQGGSRQLQVQAQAKVTDLRETGIDLELLHMSPPGGSGFDVDKFYSSILYCADDEAAELPDPSSKFDELLTRVRSKDHKKRTLCKVPFAIGAGLELAVGVYNLARRAREPYYKRLYKGTNEEVKSSVRVFSKGTGEVLMPMDIKCYQTYASKRIVFENKEKEAVKNFGLHGLRLMGFKPKSWLKQYYYVKPASFIYPDEQLVRGSTTLFCALLKKCLDRDVIPICWFSPRTNSMPELVALLPQAEEMDANRVQTTPPGFVVLVLPLAEDFRHVEPPEAPRATDEQVDKAKAVVKAMQFKFQSEAFENPALQTFYSHLEAMALDRDAPEPIVDYAEPDDEAIESRAGAQIEAFRAAALLDEAAVATPAKRRVKKEDGTVAAEPRTKKGKTAAEPAIDSGTASELDAATLAREGKLNKLTIPILKDIMKKNSIKTSATKKDDILAAICSHFGVS